MSLIQALPEGRLDIVGDIHGEFEALQNLLAHLGYDAQGRHPRGRKLVFVGDFCDRGPDSPAVLDLVQRLMASGRAVAVLGNHEINLLREDAKDGSGWFFDARHPKDHDKYAPYRRPGRAERQRIVDFLRALPIGLERPDLRVIHAAWQSEQIEIARTLPLGDFLPSYAAWEEAAQQLAVASALEQRLAADLERWEHDLENKAMEPPFLHAVAEHELNKSMINPLKVLTCGVERKGRVPFYTSGKWRFIERVQWWDDYDEPIPVVIGHYWRRVHKTHAGAASKGDQDLFTNMAPNAWHGKRRNVFCIDFSVGARWTARKAGQPLGVDCKLAALRWPEQSLMFDDGQVLPTHGPQLRGNGTAAATGN